MKRIYTKTLGALALASALFLGSAQQSEAQTLVQFSFTGSAGSNVTFPADAQPANATVSDFSRGPANTPSGASNVFVANTWPVAMGINLDNYFNFSITPNAGFVLNLDSLVLDEKRSGSGPQAWEVRSSLDNYASSIFTYTYASATVTAMNEDVHVYLGPAFQGLTSTVEFRLYAYNATAAGGTWRVDNVKLIGTVNSTAPGTMLSFQGGATTVAENVGNATMQVTIANPSATTATTVNVVATGGTATAGTDYTFTTQTLSFPAGSSAAQTITIPIIDDTDVESAETIILELQNPSTGATIGTGTFTVTITDNDTPPPAIPLVTIANASAVDPVTGVALMLGQEVKLRGINHGVNMRPANPTATPPVLASIQWTLIDNTGGIGLFRSSGDLGYTYAEGDSIEVQGTIAQFNGLTQLSVTAVTFLTANNPLVTPTVVTSLGENTESEVVRLANPVTIVDPAQWTGSGSGFSVDVTDGVNTFVMRIDNDVNLYSMPAPVGPFYLTGIGGQFDSSNPYLSGYQILPRYASDLQYVPVVSFATATQSVNENAGASTVTVQITNPGPAANTVDVVVVGGTATAGTDYTYTTQTVTFTAAGPQTVTFTVVDDNMFEGNETIEFVLQNPSTGSMAAPDTLVVTIVDNDPSAVAENIKKNVLAVYPNPAADFATVSLEGVAGKCQVQLFNSLGQLVSSLISEGATAERINMTSLSAGLYTVRVVTANEVKTGTIVKQ